MALTESNIPRTFHYLQKGYIDDTNKALLDVINDLGNLSTSPGGGFIAIDGSDTGATVSSQPFTNGISTGFVNSAAGALILRARDTPQFDTRLRTADGNVELFMAGSSGNASLTASANIELNATSIFSVLSDSVTVAANSFINIYSSTSNTTVEAAGDLRLTGSAINFSSSVFQLNGNPVASNGSPTTIDQAFFLGGGTITIENGFVTVITP